MDALLELERVTGAFEEGLRDADPAQPLQAVRWTVGQVAAHLGAVHHWAVANARTGRRSATVHVPELTVAPVTWYAEARSHLLTALRELDPQAHCSTLSKVDKTVGFWHRRQLHESLIHLWDLRSRNPEVAPPAEASRFVWTDTVDELFQVFLPRSGPAEWLDLGGTLTLLASDTRRSWTFAHDWTPGDPDAATATVTAPADVLALFCWNRLGTEVVAVDGDAGVVDRFRRSRVRP